MSVLFRAIVSSIRSDLERREANRREQSLLIRLVISHTNIFIYLYNHYIEMSSPCVRARPTFSVCVDFPTNCKRVEGIDAVEGVALTMKEK